MKQMQEISVQSDFSFSVPTQIESPGLNRLRSWTRRKIEYLADHRRDLLLTVAATMGITGIILAASYLFLVQLAAYGW